MRRVEVDDVSDADDASCRRRLRSVAFGDASDGGSDADVSFGRRLRSVAFGRVDRRLSAGGAVGTALGVGAGTARPWAVVVDAAGTMARWRRTDDVRGLQLGHQAMFARVSKRWVLCDS